jgi:hypothetical protein
MRIEDGDQVASQRHRIERLGRTPGRYKSCPM